MPAPLQLGGQAAVQHERRLLGVGQPSGEVSAHAPIIREPAVRPVRPTPMRQHRGMPSAPRALVLGAMLGVALGACASPSHPSATAPGGPASDPAGRPTYPTASVSPLPSPSTSPSAPGTITGTVRPGGRAELPDPAHAAG